MNEVAMGLIDWAEMDRDAADAVIADMVASAKSPDALSRALTARASILSQRATTNAVLALIEVLRPQEIDVDAQFGIGNGPVTNVSDYPSIGAAAEAHVAKIAKGKKA